MNETITYFCVTCADQVELPNFMEPTEISTLTTVDKSMLSHYKPDNKGLTKIVCEECHDNYFHEPLCPICRERGDYCQGHGEEEELQFGDCPICELPVCLSVDSLVHCMGHTLTEFREFDAKQAQVLHE